MNIKTIRLLFGMDMLYSGCYTVFSRCYLKIVRSSDQSYDNLDTILLFKVRRKCIYMYMAYYELVYNNFNVLNHLLLADFEENSNPSTFQFRKTRYM